jgi:ribosomal protein S18 acetylase RimI-like enzyme
VPFLKRLYASTRQEEVAVTGWPQEQIDAFLEMQFNAQRHHYLGNYTDTAWDVILVDGEPAGRLYVARWDDQIRIVDIALLPEYRGRGIGTDLIRGLFEEADASARPVRIHVEMNNPAMTLYRRLGFAPIGDADGIYLELERPPAGGAARAS